uniref:Uncharacterized protein n=1 Tax=Sphaerodactylus townsendi TaxID=933632 RepID=A0ACB8G8P2_9SAUR
MTSWIIQSAVANLAGTKRKELVLDAVSDAYLIKSSIYGCWPVLRDQPFYLNLLELFLETSYQTEVRPGLGCDPFLGTMDLNASRNRGKKAIC